MFGVRVTVLANWLLTALMGLLLWLSYESATRRKLAAFGLVCSGLLAAYETLVSGVLGFRVAGREEYSAWQVCARHTEYRRLWKCPALPVWLLYGTTKLKGGPEASGTEAG